MSVVGQIVEQAPDTNDSGATRPVGEGRTLLRHTFEPANNMRVASKVARGLKVGMVGMEVAQEAIDLRPVVFNGCRFEGCDQNLQLFLND